MLEKNYLRGSENDALFACSYFHCYVTLMH